MALLFMDGFGGGDVGFKWDLGSNFSTQSASPRLPGGYYASFGTTAASKSFTPSSKIIIGFGLSTVLTSSYFSFYGDSGATQHITITRNGSTGVLEIRRGSNGGTLLASGTTPIASGQWNYIETSVTISDTVGEVHVRLNGSPTDEVSYTGDTKNGGTNTTVDKFMFMPTTFTGSSVYLADFYICDTTGTKNNNFLGDVAIRTLSPTGNGNYSQLTNSAGNSTNNYTYVDEHPYSATDYVGSATTGLKDSYTMADLPAGVSTVYAMQIAGEMLKSDATVAQSRYFVRLSGADYAGATRTLTTSATGYYDLFESNPATGISWTAADINGMETGMEVM